MGYYTNYVLTVNEETIDGRILSRKEMESIEKELQNMCIFTDYNEYDFRGYAKWYEHEKDMALFSSKFPGVIFELRGAGENEDDIWGDYYCNGMVMNHAVEIVERPFQKDKLRAVEFPAIYSYDQS